MKRFMFVIVLLLTIAAPLLAQETAAPVQPQPERRDARREPRATYKLQFLLRELEDGKVVNTRHYVLFAEEMEFAKLRVGSKRPIVVSSGGQGGTNIQYTTIGLNLDCYVIDKGKYILLRTTLDYTGVAPETRPDASNPIMRDNRLEIPAALQLGKPTIIAEIDDVNSTHTAQVEVTITSLNK